MNLEGFARCLVNVKFRRASPVGHLLVVPCKKVGRRIVLLDRFVQDIGPKPNFRAFTGPKGRRLHKPNDSMRSIHELLVSWIQSLRVPKPHAHGAVKGRSVLTNATVHQMNRYMYIIDIADAYGTLRPRPMAEVLVEVSSALDESELDAITAWLKRYCFIGHGGLYTGEPASSELFNLYCAVRLDEPLARYAARQGLKYSRYLDDMAFSSAEAHIGTTKRRQIRERVWQAGFQLNDRKTQTGLDMAKQPIVVAGVQLQWRDGRPAQLIAPRAQRQRAETVMGLARRGAVAPAVAHGHAGATYAATRGGVKSTVPAIRDLRSEQLSLLRQFPQN